jgi:hypothetical protein
VGEAMADKDGREHCAVKSDILVRSCPYCFYSLKIHT